MILEPTLTLPVMKGSNPERRQYLTTLALRTLLVLLDPVLQQKTKGAGLRHNRLASKKIADGWAQREQVESLKPIVIAIRDTCEFRPLGNPKNSRVGLLDCPCSAVLDVCDGIQRIGALRVAGLDCSELLTNEWPVHLIEVRDDENLETVVDIIRSQTQA